MVMCTKIQTCSRTVKVCNVTCPKQGINHILKGDKFKKSKNISMYDKGAKVPKPATLSSIINYLCLLQTSVIVETEAISTASLVSFNLQPLSDSQTQILINEFIPELTADDHDDGND